MNKLLLTVLAFLLFAILVIGVIIVGNRLSSESPAEGGREVSFPTSSTVGASALPTEQEAEAIRGEFFGTADATGLQVENIRVAGNYAISDWFDENMGGVALYERDQQGVWSLVVTDGGAWTVNDLIILGVPQESALQLLGAGE